MRIISTVALAILLAMVLAYPSAAVVLTTNAGFADAQQLATPVGFVTLFLTHENDEVYRVKTDASGVAKAKIPPGSIVHCQAYNEDRHVASWACHFPVDKKTVSEIAGNARQPNDNETPIPPDSRPTAVVSTTGGGSPRSFYLDRRNHKWTRVPGTSSWLSIRELVDLGPLQSGDDSEDMKSPQEALEVFVSLFFPPKTGETSSGDAAGADDAGGDD